MIMSEDCDKDGDDNSCCKIYNYYCACILYSQYFYCSKLQISPETPLIKAFHLFAEKRVSALPVVDDRGTSLYDVWSLLTLKLIIKVAKINFKYKELHICSCQKMGGSQEVAFVFIWDKNASNQRISFMYNLSCFTVSSIIFRCCGGYLCKIWCYSK